jgi:hypothetical protein
VSVLRSQRFAALMTVCAVATLGASAFGADARAQKREADLLRQKVDGINKHAERPTKQGRRTTVTESEVNAYLAIDARPQLPTGVVDPSVTIVGTGRLSGRAVVDLDAVRTAKNPTSLLDPVNYLSGKVPVTATGVLTTKNGVGRFVLESAAIGRVPVPKLILQEIVSYYSRSAQKPTGIGLDDPFELPAKIREIQVLRGQAIIVQ